MKAEEATEISLAAVEKVDVSYYLGRIKTSAEDGAFSTQFGMLSPGVINALRQRGYDVCESWASTTVRWAPQSPGFNTACVPPGPGINYR
jgi:hypothetical protein